MTSTIFAPQGGEVQVNSYTTSDQGSPKLAALANGGYVVTWSSVGQDGSGFGIYTQRYDASGTPIGGEVQVNTVTAGNQNEPSVAALGGGYVVTWTSSGQDGSGLGIYAQRYDASGAAVGGEVQVNTYTSGDQFKQSVTGLADGGFVVTWMSEGQDGSSWGVYAQRYDASGAAVGGEVQVNTYTDSHQQQPSVTALADGGYVVTWISQGQDGSGLGIYAQRYDASGNPVGGELQVNTYTNGDQVQPSVTSLTDGGYVVAWLSLGQDGSGFGVFAQRYDASGAAVGGEAQVNTYTSNDQYQPSVTGLADGGYVVTWTSYGQDGSSWGIYAQRYDTSGAAVGGEVQVNTYTDNLQIEPSVIGLADGGYVIGWNSYGQDGSGYGIYAQRYSATITGTENDDIIIGTAHDDTIAGLGGNDLILGSAGNDTLNGGGGNDVLTGGAGNDSLDGGAGIDTASYADAAGPIDLDLGAGVADEYDAAGSTIVSRDTLTGIENVTGSAFDDAIVGDGADNVLDGLGGDDFIQGRGGNDTLYGGDGNDFLQGDAGDAFIGPSGNDTLYGGNGDDSLRGGLGDDQLFGGDGDDHLRGNGGVDYFDGGAETGLVNQTSVYGDRVSFFEVRATQGAVADLRTGVISNDGFGNVETMTGIESLGADTAYVDTFHGNDSRNFLWGSLGDNLYGHGGDDLLWLNAAGAVDGGAGIDLLSLPSVGFLLPDADSDGLAEDAPLMTSGWTVNLAAGTLVDGYGNTGSVTGVENVDGSPFDDTLYGDANANVLNGLEGNDTLVGQEGNNQLFGGAGNDFIEGGLGNDYIAGGDDDDLLVGERGDDIIDGGAGVDRAGFFLNAQNGVTVDLNLQGVAQDTGQGMDTLISIENLWGTRFADTLIGDGGDNIIWGVEGNDTLYGGGGNDQLSGGDGDDILEGGLGDDTLNGDDGIDTASYANASGSVSVNLATGFASGADGFDTLGSIENVIGSEFDDTLFGDAGNNVIDGLGGNDFLRGGAGNDTLYGGEGNDVLRGDFDDTFVGPSGNDTLYGGNGDDVLRGGAGDDQLFGGSGDDHLRGNGGVDYFDGGSESGLENPATGYGDRVSFFEPLATAAVIADLRTGIISNDGFGNVETMVGIESLGADTAFADTFHGNDSRNAIFASRGDSLYGHGGDDLLQLSSAAAVVDGGSGTDVLRLGGFNFLLPDADGDGVAEDTAPLTSGWIVNLATGTFLDGDGYSGSVTGIENVDGSSFDDTITGDANANVLRGLDGDDTLQGGLGNDTLNGGGGNDTLGGGKGNDVLVGGGGDDVLSGGAGRDSFVFGVASGNDHITDFTKGELIVISGVAGVDDVSDLTITNVGGSAVISWGTGDTITLDGYKASKLTAADFAFGSSATIVAGAVAAAGLMSVPAAAESHSGDDSLVVSATALLAGNEIEASVQGGGKSDGSAVMGQIQEPEGNAAYSADIADKDAPHVSDANTLAGGNSPPAALLTELLHGTDTPAHSGIALVAQTVGMPSAEMLQCVADVAQTTGEVARVLADTLSGRGDNPHTLDALLDALPGNANGSGAAVEVMASHGVAGIGSWDIGNFAIFSSANLAFTDALAVHHDAPPVV